MTKFLRESKIIKGSRVEARSSLAGSTTAFSKDIYTKAPQTPHEEMKEVMSAMDNNTFFESAVNTATDFILGDDLVYDSKDEFSAKSVQGWLENSLKVDTILREAVRHTISTGNGYIEQDLEDPRTTNGLLIPKKLYPIVDSSAMFVNSDPFGEPLKKEVVTTTGPVAAPVGTSATIRESDQ